MPAATLTLLIGIVVGIGLEHLAAAATGGPSLHPEAWGQPPAVLTAAPVSFGTAGAVAAEAWGSLRSGTQEALLGLAVLTATTILAIGLGRAQRSSTPPEAASEPAGDGLVAIPLMLVAFVAESAVSRIFVLGQLGVLVVGALSIVAYAGCLYQASRGAGAGPRPGLQAAPEPSATHPAAEFPTAPMPTPRRSSRRRRVSLGLRLRGLLKLMRSPRRPGRAWRRRRPRRSPAARG